MTIPNDVFFFSSEKMSDCQFTYREPWQLKQRLPERLEPRGEKLKKKKSPSKFAQLSR